MATANAVQVLVGEWPSYYRHGISEQSSETASKLLQENHEKFDIFFNDKGFHNHIVHHILTLWALNASPKQLQMHYDNNKSYQRPIPPVDESVLRDLEDPAKFITYLGPRKYYNDFLVFFQRAIERQGWQDVVQQYVFSGDERANAMLGLMFAGLLHPIIHLGFGIEFHQPAIIAEALAMAACHKSSIAKLLWAAEKAAAEQTSGQDKPWAQLVDEIYADSNIHDAVSFTDQDRLEHIHDPILPYLSQIRVQPGDLSRKVAELANATAYFAGVAQRPDKAVRFDFSAMHCANSTVFFPTFMQQDWLSEENKVRLVEWAMRYNLAVYASSKPARLPVDEIRKYQPSKPSGWEDIQDRICDMKDDGHASKFVRALSNAARVSETYEGDDAFRLKAGDLLKLGHMVVDSAENSGGQPHWLRGAGFDEAWQEVPGRARS